MNVPFVDLVAQNRPLAEELMGALSERINDGSFILGAEVSAFEREVSALLETRHAVGVSSGTDALLVSLMALEIGAGDEVITTPFSFFATGGVIQRLGATPVFADIRLDDYLLDPNKVAERVTPRTVR